MPPVPIPSRLSEYVPDVENSGSDSEDTTPGMMSPTQRNGPLDLSAEEINARMNGTEDRNEPRPSLDAMMPALAMMRTNNGSQADLLFERQEPPVPPLPTMKMPEPMFFPAMSMPEPVLTGMGVPLRVDTSSPPFVLPRTKSPIMEAMPMQPLSAASVMSPDEMLRAYAERRRKGGSGMTTLTSPPGTPGPTISYPMPAAINSGPNVGVTSPVSTMRTLYSPAGNASTGATVTAHGTGSGSDGTTNPFRKSIAPSRRSDDTQFADEDVSH